MSNRLLSNRKRFTGFPGRQDQSVTEYVSGACGTGKTLAACAFIKETHRSRKTLFIVPTVKLAQQTLAVLREMGVVPIVITSEEAPKHVVRKITETIRNAPEGIVVLITWKAYERIRHFQSRGEWTIIIDEIPQLDTFYEPTLPEYHCLLTDHLDVLRSHDNENIGILCLKSRQATKEYLDGVRDDAGWTVRDIIADVYSENRIVYVDMESWTRICEDEEVGKTDSSNTIYILSILNWQLFKGAILLGANVETSMLKSYLEKNHGAKFRVCEPIAGKLRSPRSFGDRVQICYFLENTRISKNFSKKAFADGVANIDEMDRLAAEKLGDRPFLYVCNKDRKGKSPVIDRLANKIDVPVMSHGSNEYLHSHAIYLSPSLNRSPKQFKMLEWIGIPSEVVQRSSAYETYYQGVMRTSLRDDKSSEPVLVIVPDRFVGEHLSEALGSKNLLKIGEIKEKKPLPPYTNTEKRQRLESKDRWKAIFCPETVPETLLGPFGVTLGKPQANTGNPLNIVVTFHCSRYDSKSEQFIVAEETIQKFIGLMRKESRTVVEDKDDRYMFNSGRYEVPDGAVGYRKQEYFAGSSCLILDFDNGELSPDDFKSIFGKSAPKEQRRSFIIFNSFSRSPEQPNRFRAVMFLKRPLTSLEEHRAVFDWINEVLDFSGYPASRSGLDRGCRSGNQSFYMPCTNRENKEWWFFENHWTRDREIAEYAIDPDCCLALHSDQTVPVQGSESSVPGPCSPDRIETICEPYRLTTDGTNWLGYVVVCKLARAGLSDTDIEMKMKELARGDRKKLRRISGYLKSLAQHRQSWRT